MNTYCLTVRLQSPLVTRFEADTIFGHICWAMRYADDKGEENLGAFLQEYESNPPLYVSEGFSSGLLPRPVLSPLAEEERIRLTREYYGSSLTDRLACRVALKGLAKQRYVSRQMFEALQGNFSNFNLFSKLFEADYCPKDFRPKQDLCTVNKSQCPLLFPAPRKKCSLVSDSRTELVAHNTIDRSTNTVKKEGGFYAQSQMYIRAGLPIDIFLRLCPSEKNRFMSLFEWIGQSGFGKDKSTGKGHFKVESFDEANLPEPGPGELAMSLSSFVPRETDGAVDYYEIYTKYGKLGGHYANCPIEEFPVSKPNPYKKPILFMKTGATYRVNGKSEMGQLLKDIHQSKKIRHYAYAFSVAI